MDISIKFLLSDTRLFQTLSPEECAIVEAKLVVKNVKAGAELYKEGEHAKSVCFVASGELEVLKQDGKGVGHRIATIKAGQSVGEMGIIDGMIRSATIKAVTDCTVVLFKRDDFEVLMQQHPAISFKILQELSRSLSIALRKTSSDFVSSLT